MNSYSPKSTPRSHMADPKLSNQKVLQREAIYVIGIHPEIAEESVLNQPRFFGQFGPITKIFVSQKPYKLMKSDQYCYNAFITFEHPVSAALAVISLDKFYFKSIRLQGSFGSNKICSYFSAGMTCLNKRCNFVHKKLEECELLPKENKHVPNRQNFEMHKSSALSFLVSQIEEQNVPRFLYKYQPVKNRVLKNPYQILLSFHQELNLPFQKFKDNSQQKK